MTRRKPRQTTLDTMVARIVVPVLTTTSQEELCVEFVEEANWIATAFEYLSGGEARVERLMETLKAEFFDCDCDVKRQHIADSLQTIGRIGEAVDRYQGDAHEAWLHVFGVHTYRLKKRQEKMGERLSTLGHLSRCLEL